MKACKKSTFQALKSSPRPCRPSPGILAASNSTISLPTPMRSSISAKNTACAICLDVSRTPMLSCTHQKVSLASFLDKVAPSHGALSCGRRQGRGRRRAADRRRRYRLGRILPLLQEALTGRRPSSRKSGKATKTTVKAHGSPWICWKDIWTNR